MKDAQFTHTFQMRVNDDLMQAVDGWRRKQSDLPSRAEAIRRLVQLGLGSSPASDDSPKPHGDKLAEPTARATGRRER